MKLRARALVGLSILMCGAIALLVVTGTGRRTRVDAQGSSNGQLPTLDQYQLKSDLVTREHKIDRAKYPLVDIHSHHWNPTADHVDQLVKEMDTINLRVLVNLSGGTGESLNQTLATMKGR